jgi:hypothetical protein
VCPGRVLKCRTSRWISAIAASAVLRVSIRCGQSVVPAQDFLRPVEELRELPPPPLNVNDFRDRADWSSRAGCRPELLVRRLGGARVLRGVERCARIRDGSSSRRARAECAVRGARRSPPGRLSWDSAPPRCPAPFDLRFIVAKSRARR